MAEPTPDPRKPGADDPAGGAAPEGAKANGKADGKANGKANAKANAKANGAAEPKPDIPNPFDAEAFRLPPEGEPGSGVEVQRTRLKVRKPKKTEFFRCHPTLRMMAAVLEKEDGFDKNYYLAAPAVAAMNAGELKKVELCLSINRDGTLFVWPIPQPREGGKSNDWGVSARDGAHQALTHWMRLKPDIPNGQYTVIRSQVYNQEPVWPADLTLGDVLERAFGSDGFIRDEDHPELKALRGE